MYLIHTPFGMPETDGPPKTDENNDIVLDLETDHVATWKVYKNKCMQYQQYIIITNYLFKCRKWKKWLMLV